jgi:hypothetical protein
MTDSSADDVRLRATEAQMRRALGLQDASPRSRGVYQPTPTIATRRPPRHFVRDGEVPVTFVHRDYRRDDPPGSNLDTTRRALTEQTTAKKVPAVTQATIRDLQTQLASERLAKDEALEAARRAAAETRAAQQNLRTVQDELLDERLARQNAEQEREEFIAARMTG